MQSLATPLYSLTYFLLLPALLGLLLSMAQASMGRWRRGGLHREGE